MELPVQSQVLSELSGFSAVWVHTTVKAIAVIMDLLALPKLTNLKTNKPQ